jgi:hypothetical protein
MQQQPGNELYAELLRTYDTLMRVCTEIEQIRDPRKRTQEFVNDENFSRLKRIEIDGVSPNLVIQGLSQRAVEIESFFTALSKRNKDTIGKRQRREDEMDTIN